MALEEKNDGGFADGPALGGGGRDNGDRFAEDFAADTLEAEFREALNLDSWTAGTRMNELSARLEREVEKAVRDEALIAPRSSR